MNAIHRCEQRKFHGQAGELTHGQEILFKGQSFEFNLDFTTMNLVFSRNR
jgi:hypothetical protein